MELRKIVLVFLLGLTLTACKSSDNELVDTQSSPGTVQIPTNPIFEEQDQNNEEGQQGDEPVATEPSDEPGAQDPDSEDLSVITIEPDNEEIKIDLGRFLFHDKVLSGNKKTSCATCHPVWNGTTDGLSLAIGDGGIGHGVNRVAGYAFERVPRNTQALYNIGHLELKELFHDGRVSESSEGTFETPAGDDLPQGLKNVLAAQALFPLITAVEMAGYAGENAVANRVDQGDLQGAWDVIVERIREIPHYVEIFKAAFGDVVSAHEIQIHHIANAIAAYETDEFRATNSPFDRYLEGDQHALSPAARRGKEYFYGGANCASCHSGDFQSDFQFHSIGLPQIGPGQGVGRHGLEDFGRAQVTGQVEDRYKFRTPSLRNVAITGPWGHSGAYTSLRSMVEHYRNPRFAMEDYNPQIERPLLPLIGENSEFDFIALLSPGIFTAVGDSHQITAPSIALTDDVVDDIVAFLYALTDESSLHKQPPVFVPSGLPVH